MLEGTIEFLRNGQSWGIAFKDGELAKGELVAAISPIYLNDAVTLRSMIKEDWVVYDWIRVYSYIKVFADVSYIMGWNEKK